MKRKYKSRVYALFQMTTFIALILIVFGLMFFMLNANQTNQTINYDFWSKTFSNVLIFDTVDVGGVFSALFVYVGLLLWVVSWVIGWMMLRYEDRNIFDQMFILFLMVPVISNVFALLAQLFVESAKYTPEKITKDETKIEKTNIIKLFNKSEKDKDSHIKKLIAETSSMKIHAHTKKSPIKTVAPKRAVNKKSKNKSKISRKK